MEEQKTSEQPQDGEIMKEESVSDDSAKQPEEKADEKKAQAGEYPDIKPGMTIKVHQKIKEITPKGEKERIQIFEGMVLARKKGKGITSTITVRKVSNGIGVEKIFPLHSPSIAKIEPVKQARIRRSKLYYLRTYKKKLREKKIS